MVKVDIWRNHPVEFTIGVLHVIIMCLMFYVEKSGLMVTNRQSRTRYYIVSFVVCDILQWFWLALFLRTVPYWPTEFITLSLSVIPIFAQVIYLILISFNHAMLIYHSIRRTEHQQLHLEIKLRLLICVIFLIVAFGSILYLFTSVHYGDLLYVQLQLSILATPCANMLLSKGIKYLNFGDGLKNLIKCLAVLPPFFVPFFITLFKRCLDVLFEPRMDFESSSHSFQYPLLDFIWMLSLSRDICLSSRFDHGVVFFFNAIDIAEESEHYNDAQGVVFTR